MKLIAVLDSSVVVSGIGWRGDAHKVLGLLAHRGFICVRTPWLTDEWAETLSRVSAETKWHNRNWANWLEWLKAASLLIDDPPLRRTVRRDAKDDPVIAAAVAARASHLVAYDNDILDLQKPYGVHCVKPRAFIEAIVARD
jgi:putative PIN family toxin of toxin-antitoxin system